MKVNKEKGKETKRKESFCGKNSRIKSDSHSNMHMFGEGKKKNSYMQKRVRS